MMRAMRVIYKPVFVVVAITFIGWLAYDEVTDILGGGRDVVLKVNGEIVRAPQFQAAPQNVIGESRRRGGGRLSREDEQQLQDFFFFQAEDGIRDLTVTGVQTCALPI